MLVRRTDCSAYNTLWLWSVNWCSFYFYNNFAKCAPIVIILSRLHSEINRRKAGIKICHLAWNLLLLHLAKFECLTVQLLSQTLISFYDDKLGEKFQFDSRLIFISHNSFVPFALSNYQAPVSLLGRPEPRSGRAYILPVMFFFATLSPRPLNRSPWNFATWSESGCIL